MKTYPILDRIESPHQLRRLTGGELRRLAEEMRQRIIEVVSRQGGHLASNLGVAELTTTARIVLGSDVGNTPFWVATYLTVGLLYFVVAFAVSRLALRGERRYQAGNLVRSLAIPTAKTGSRL